MVHLGDKIKISGFGILIPDVVTTTEDEVCQNALRPQNNNNCRK